MSYENQYSNAGSTSALIGRLAIATIITLIAWFTYENKIENPIAQASLQEEFRIHDK